MCPITAVGRVITCICALFGSATMGMLTSVLVDRYQRVFNRKMYVSDSEIPPAVFDMKRNLDDEVKSIRSVPSSIGRRQLSKTLSHQLSSLQEKTKNDGYQDCKLQFVISFNDRRATDHVATMMKNKLTEAILTTGIDMNLKLIDDDRKELWIISSSDLQATSTSKITLSMDVDDEKQKQLSNIEIF
jgi:hypothetical protein